MSRGIHGEKLLAAMSSEKLPSGDKSRLACALERYDQWLEQLKNVNEDSTEAIIEKMVRLLNEYKLFIDLDLIFDSPDDFLYRQKCQLKIDNTVIEEFLPILVGKCLQNTFDSTGINIGPQTPTYSSVYFNSSLSNPGIGGGITLKTKDQDFAMTRKLYIRSSYSRSFEQDRTITVEANLGYILAEIKTNLDKTMFQEASATAHDIKLAVSGGKYFLLCDFLDMTPISTATTDIDEILILRKAKRINSNVRAKYNTFSGRQKLRTEYESYLTRNPYSVDVFTRFIDHVFAQMTNEELAEDDVLTIGYF